MSLSNSWRIARNTSIVYSHSFLKELQANEEAAAGKGGAAAGARPDATRDRGRTDNTEVNPQTR